jgi:selenocysteine lyase/cysteine desulfurase
MTSIDSTIQDLETNLPGTATDGRTLLLIQRSELVQRRAKLEDLRSNATALRTSLSKSFPIRVTRTRFETATLFGAPKWALALAIALLLIVVVAAGGAIFGQRAHTAADVAGAFPNVKVVGAPPRPPTTSHLEVQDGTLHLDLSKVSLSEIALILAENNSITSIAAHYPNESTFRTAIALGA